MVQPSSKGIGTHGRRKPFISHSTFALDTPLFHRCCPLAFGRSTQPCMQRTAQQQPNSIISEIIVNYCPAIPVEDRQQIRTSADANALFRKLYTTEIIEYEEQFYILYLSRSNDVIGYHLHSIGGASGTVVDVKQVLAIAVKANACSIILSHNHPSGNLRPSEADRSLTRKIVQGGSALDVSVLDHLILTKHAYYSFADEGIMPSTTTTY